MTEPDKAALRTVLTRLQAHSPMLACDAESAGIIYVTLWQDELWATDCGAIYAALENEGVPTMDDELRGAIEAICEEHGCRWDVGAGSGPWITRRIEDGESVDRALAAIREAIEGVLRSARRSRDRIRDWTQDRR